MKCVKTGCDLYLRNRGLYLHGDLFVPYYRAELLNAELGLAMLDRGAEEMAGGRPASALRQDPGQSILVNLLMRVSGHDRSPMSSVLHVIAEREDHWFDMTHSSPSNDFGTSTLLISANQARWLGYDGAHLQDVF